MYLFSRSRFTKLLLALIAVCSLVVSIGFSPLVAALETDLLEQKEGYQGKILGARVEEVSVVEGERIKQLTVSIPKSNGPIEEVIVTARRLDSTDREKPIFQMKPYTFIKDYDNDRFGLIIYVGENNQLPFRLYFKGEPEQ